MKKLMTLFGAIIFAAAILTSCGGSSTKNLTNEATDQTNQTEEATDQTNQTETNEESANPPKSVEYCHTCGAAISGVPYEAFARTYCNMKCYADDPDM